METWVDYKILKTYRSNKTFLLVFFFQIIINPVKGMLQ